MKQVVKTIGKINNGTREMLFSNMENRDVNILQNMGEMLNDTFTKLDDGKIVDTLNFYRKSAKIQRSDVKLCTEDHDHHRHCRIDKSNPWQKYYLTESDEYDSVSSGNHSETDEIN